MKYLLDTHTLLWVLFDDDKLSNFIQKTIKNTENTIFVSIISYWEIALKYGLGKLILDGITPDILPQKASEIDIDPLPLSITDVATFYKLPKRAHKDPFDRLLIWQAINNDLPLLSKDKRMKEYSDLV